MGVLRRTRRRAMGVLRRARRRAMGMLRRARRRAVGVLRRARRHARRVLRWPRHDRRARSAGRGGLPVLRRAGPTLRRPGWRGGRALRRARWCGGPLRRPGCRGGPLRRTRRPRLSVPRLSVPRRPGDRRDRGAPAVRGRTGTDRDLRTRPELPPRRWRVLTVGGRRRLPPVHGRGPTTLVGRGHHPGRSVPRRLVALLRRHRRAALRVTRVLPALRRPRLVVPLVLGVRPLTAGGGRTWSGGRTRAGRLGCLVDRRVHGLPAPRIARIALARGLRLPLPGDLVDPGGLVTPTVVPALGAPAVHRAPRCRPGDWQRSVTVESTSSSKMCGGRPETRVESPGSTAGF
jgi:hypothetical protein